MSLGNEISIRNNCSFTIWPGILGVPAEKGQPEDGGFELGAGQTKVIAVNGDWQGRIWARTRCNESGHCETGGCGDKIKCDGAEGVPPVTIAKLTFGGNKGYTDGYQINLNDGYNLPIKIAPTSGYSRKEHGKYDCKPSGCNTDLNKICPDDLSVKSGKSIVACMSACLKYDTDIYCCRNQYESFTNCNSSTWPVNYPAVFKRACPDAFIYDYDRSFNTFSCRSEPAVNYEIVFCP